MLGLILSRSSFNFNSALISFLANSISDETPVPEIIRYLFICTTFSVSLLDTICPPKVVLRSPAMTIPSLQTIPTRLVPVFKIFFLMSSSIC